MPTIDEINLWLGSEATGKRIGWDVEPDDDTDIGWKDEGLPGEITGELTSHTPEDSSPYDIGPVVMIAQKPVDPETVVFPDGGSADDTEGDKVEAHMPGLHDQSRHGRKGGVGYVGPSYAVAEPFLGSASEAHKERLNTALDAHGERLDHVLEVAGLDKMSDPGRGVRGQDSLAIHSNWSADGEWEGFTPERLETQDSILEGMEAAQIEKNGRAPLQDRQAIIMAGLPGAGKTYLLENELSSEFDLEDYVVVNADDVKVELVKPEFDPPKVGDLEGMELASMVHEESSFMSKKWERKITSSGTNVALDITAANEAKTTQRIQSLIDQGYTVHIVHADVSPVEAMVSAVERYGRSGRPVPLEFISDMADRSDLSRTVIDGAWPKYRDAVNGTYRSYRTQPVDQTATKLQEAGP